MYCGMPANCWTSSTAQGGLDHAEHVVTFAVAAKMRSSLNTLARAVADAEHGDAGLQ
jgi:hypothetical protein